MLNTRETMRAVHAIVRRFSLNDEQQDKFADALQFDNILMAAHMGRWDQVTILLIQEKVIEKWPA